MDRGDGCPYWFKKVYQYVGMKNNMPFDNNLRLAISALKHRTIGSIGFIVVKIF